MTNDADFYEYLKTFRHHGIQKIPARGKWYYEISNPGYNYRITDIQCALGISQFKKLSKFIKLRRSIVKKYNEAFADLQEIVLPFEEAHVKAAYHIYPIRLRLERLKKKRKEIFDAFQEKGIGVQVHYVPVHFHPFYQKKLGYKKGDFPVTEAYYEEAITLPVFPRMTAGEVERVIRATKQIVETYRVH